MKPRRQTLKYLTFVTIGSLDDPGLMNRENPVNQSPLPTLSKLGHEEMLVLWRELKLFEAPPIDHIFVAAPFNMWAAVGEMSLTLTGDMGTGYAELPSVNFPLMEEEGDRIHRILSLEPGSSLGQVFQDPTNRDFLYSYGRYRCKLIPIYANIPGALHGLVIGLPILVQAIALTFAKGGEEKRRIENIVPKNGHALQIDIATGSLRIPSEERLSRLTHYPG